MNNVGQLLFQAAYDGITGALKALIKYEIFPHYQRKIEEMNEEEEDDNEEEETSNQKESGEK